MILIAVTYTRKLESWLKMGLNRAIFITMIYVFLGLNVCACKPQVINVDVVDIYLGMSAKEFSVLPYSYVEKQPMGVNFYNTNWHGLYTIHFKHGNYGFDIPRMDAVRAYESLRVEAMAAKPLPFSLEHTLAETRLFISTNGRLGWSRK